MGGAARTPVRADRRSDARIASEVTRLRCEKVGRWCLGDARQTTLASSAKWQATG
jgi:hypothetical protein